MSVKNRILFVRIVQTLRIKLFQDQITSLSKFHEQKVVERTAALADAHINIVWRLGKAAYKDKVQAFSIS